MAPHEQKKKNRNRKTEVVMLHRSYNPREIHTMKLWRQEVWNAHHAGICLLPKPELKTVRVYERYSGIPRYENAGMIKISNHATRLVDLADSTCDIESCADNEAIVRLREMPLA